MYKVFTLILLSTALVIGTGCQGGARTSGGGCCGSAGGVDAPAPDSPTARNDTPAPQPAPAPAMQRTTAASAGGAGGCCSK